MGKILQNRLVQVQDLPRDRGGTLGRANGKDVEALASWFELGALDRTTSRPNHPPITGVHMLLQSVVEQNTKKVFNH